ncbi:MAG: DUF4097 family beta strand repeat-containing protein [Elusimicrobiota bacterium]|jgi:hypothetical protein|nr:DUF4097 family beta strand repeat-containing protein [Elusimicrobiota bacterium]
MAKISAIILSFMICAAPAAAADRLVLPLEGVSDIFITASTADITLAHPRGGAAAAIQWREKHCALDIAEPAKGVLQINIIPKPQHVFVKEILGVKQTPCKVILEAPAGKNIYAASETGLIKLADFKAKSLRLYTGSGAVDIESYEGLLWAETLTGKINARNIISNAADFKSAGGAINAAGRIKKADIFNTSGPSRLSGAIDSLRFYSSEGDLWASWEQMPPQPPEISARSFAGDLQILLPPKTDLQKAKKNIRLQTFYGKASLLPRGS